MMTTKHSSLLWVQEEHSYSSDFFGSKGVSLADLHLLTINGKPAITLFLEGSVQRIKVHFVGAAVLGAVTIYSLPKFAPAYSPDHMAESIHIMRTTMRSMQSVGHRKLASQFKLQSEELITEPSWLGSAQFLLDDYAKNGSYTSRQSVLEQSGDGDIDWIETLERSPVLLQNGRPIYTETYINNLYLDPETIVARVHLAVLADILDKLGLIDPLGILGLPAIELNKSERLEHLGSRMTLERTLEGELRIQFEDRKVRLLRALVRYLREGADYSNAIFKSFVGTSSFHVIWEQACAWFFQDIFSARGGRTRAPIWSFFVEESGVNDVVSFDGEGVLLPDIVSEDQNGIYILDAKYYLPAYSASGIRYQPGVQDLAKQYLYPAAVQDLFEGRPIRGNAFVMPSRQIGTGTLCMRGEVEFPFLATPERSPLPIVILEIDPLLVLEYFNGRKLPQNLSLSQAFSLQPSELFSIERHSRLREHT